MKIYLASSVCVCALYDGVLQRKLPPMANTKYIAIISWFNLQHIFCYPKRKVFQEIS